MHRLHRSLFLAPPLLPLLSFLFIPTPSHAQTPPPSDVLPGSNPLTEAGDFAAKMVAGIDAYLMRELAAAPEKRRARWAALDASSPETWAKSVEPLRERLRKIIGAVDPRKPATALEYVASTESPSVVAHGSGLTVHAVRWPVFDGVDSEGLLLDPRKPSLSRLIVLPDADETPEQVAGLVPVLPPEMLDVNLRAHDAARAGALVIIPALIDRADTWSGNPAVRYTNQPHREWIYRASYTMGRHVIGYEVQKVLSAVDWFVNAAAPDDPDITLYGRGEGGLLALVAAAIDPRIDTVIVSGYFQERENLWQEPIYRNVWSLLRDFGDAELAALIAPRRLTILAFPGPKRDGPPPPREGRAGAAPGRLESPPKESVAREFQRALAFYGRLNARERIKIQWEPEIQTRPSPELLRDERPAFDPATRLKRQFDQLNEHTQRLVRRSEKTREAFWSKADTSSLDRFVETSKPLREHLWSEIIGKLPPPPEPARPRARKAYDEPMWTGYEVTLDLYPDVFAYGVLLVPKDIKPGERRPVVVCQHGLEGRPQHTINGEKQEGYHYYKAFAARLAERGFVVYSPQNPYIGKDDFRVLQRKANPLGLSLYSFIVRQHERTVDWLAAQPFIDPARIGFYGLSYGGKTAMRIPTILADRFALSSCSADYNEWIKKNTAIDHLTSYMFHGEYEMFEFDLGNTFNYAEMSWLMIPRPFMVERGHDDAAGIDSWVAWEYAKVRYRYDKLGLGDRTTIEFFDGPHTINGKGTFEFLHKHLAWPGPEGKPKTQNPKSQ